MTLQDGRPIGGRYRIVRKIAEGGMGAVYEAQHTVAQRTVALKILFSHASHDPQHVKRFVREASASARIKHPSIVEVFDAGLDEDGTCFVAMELLEGRTLREWLAGRPPLGEVLAMFEQILDPLAAAHDAGLIHRDLKPENVFLAQTREGELVKILDFGIARDVKDGDATKTGVAMGTASYMAPEQAMSASHVTSAADVWALGIMLYEAIAHRVPFVGDTPTAVVFAAYTQAHVPITALVPQFPAPISALIDACLEKAPTNRPKNARELAAALAEVRGARVAATLPMSPAPFGTPVVRTEPLTQERAWAPAPQAAPRSTFFVPALLGGLLTVALLVACPFVLLAARPWEEPPPVRRSEPPSVRAPAPTTGTLALSSRGGGWAEVREDGATLGRTPLHRDMPVGRHELEIFPNGEPPPTLLVVQIAPGMLTRQSIDARPRAVALPAECVRYEEDACRCDDGAGCARAREATQDWRRDLAADPSSTLRDEIGHECESRLRAAPCPSAAPAGPRVAPTRNDVVNAMNAIAPEASRCDGDQHGATVVRVVFASSGRVVSASVLGGSSPVDSCVARAVRQARLEPFTQPTFTIAFPLRL